jgi:hypothetical protein
MNALRVHGKPRPSLHLRSETRNHRQMHAVALGDRRKRFAGSATLDGFSALKIAQLALAAELDAGSHSALAAFAGALTN